MNKTHTQVALLSSLTALSIALAACVPQAILATKTISGPISAFGDTYPSAFVNGTQYDLSNAKISIDGSPATIADLKVGMFAKVKGRSKDHRRDNPFNANAQDNDGEADEIEIDDEVEGEVTSTNIGQNQTGTIVVMGQTVSVKPETVFESDIDGITSIAQITTNMIVEVHGHSDGEGNITATRIELKDTNLPDFLLDDEDGMELEGIITNLNITAMTFQIGNTTIDYSTAEIEDGALQNNMHVEVESKTSIQADGIVIASEVEIEDDGDFEDQGDEGQSADIQGAVTASFADGQFKVDGQTVFIDVNTVLDGISATQLTNGTAVEVKGTYKNGNLLATYITAGETTQAQLSGVVTEIYPVGTNSGSFVVQGQTIVVNNETIIQFSDGTISQSLLNLGGLDVNDNVIVDYFIDPTTQALIAVKVTR